MLSYCFIDICTFSLYFINFGLMVLEIIICMVLKYMGLSSSDQIPVHENWCLTLKVSDFSNGYLGIYNENVYINHTFC